MLIDEGTENIAVNAPIALILEEGKDESALEAFDVASPAPAVAPVIDADVPQTQQDASQAPPATSAAPQPASNGQVGVFLPLPWRVVWLAKIPLI